MKTGSDFDLPEADRIPGTFDLNRSGNSKLGLPIRPRISGDLTYSGPMKGILHGTISTLVLDMPRWNWKRYPTVQTESWRQQ